MSEHQQSTPPGEAAPAKILPQAVRLTYFGSGDYATCRPLTLVAGWSEFYDVLRNARPSRTTEKSLLLSWSPATFRGRRSIANVVEVAACVLDFDNTEKVNGKSVPLPPGRRTSPEQALCLWDGTECFFYTSWSHGPDLDKFRLIIPYPRPLCVGDHEVVREYVWKRIADAGHVLDASCKDPSRLWFIGNNGRDYRVGWQDGDLLEIDAIIETASMALLEAEALSAPVAEETVVARRVVEPESAGAIARARRYIAWKPGAVSGHHGHDTTRGVALMLAWGFALSESQTLDLLAEYNAKCDPPWSNSQLAHKVRGILAWASAHADRPRGWALQDRHVQSPLAPPDGSGAGSGGARPPDPADDGDLVARLEPAASAPPASSSARPPDGEDERPAIYVSPDEMRVNDEAVAALSRDNSVYARGNRLVRVLRMAMDPLPVETLREHLAAAARWFSWTTKGDGAWTRCHPPAWSVQAVDKRGSWEGIRELTGVVTYPTLLPDGRLLTEPGYDTGSGLLYLQDSTWDLPADPSRTDALHGVATLRQAVEQFPWQEPVDFAAWLAELLTVVGRHAIRGPYPMFAHSANVKGTGKGKLAQVIAVIATGESVPEGKLPDDEDEREKRMTGLSVSGRPYVLFDEAAEVAGPTLQMVATSRRISGRILGETGDYTGPWDTVVVFAANNLQIGEDMIRRVVPVRLLTPLEKPWDREDLKQKNLLAWVTEHRRELLTAALVILRAYVAAGRPDVRVGALGSYEEWTALVPSALVWLGLPNVTKAVARDDADAERAAILAFMTAWRSAIGVGKTMLSAEVRTYAELGTRPDDTVAPDDDVVTDVSLSPERPSTADPRTTFVKALCAFCPPRASADVPSAAAIGHALKRIKNRVVAGMRFTSRQDTHTKLHGWALQLAEVAEVGEIQPPHTQMSETKGVAEVAEDAEVDRPSRAREGHPANGGDPHGSIKSTQRTGDQPPHPPQPPQGQSLHEVASAEVANGRPPQPPQDGIASAPSSSPLRCRAVWATLDTAPEGERLTVALLRADGTADARPNIFHFRVGPPAVLQAVLDLYGWTGNTGSDGALVGFNSEVCVSTRKHVFEGGQPSLIVTACVGVVTPPAS